MAKDGYDANKEYLREIDRILTERLGDRAKRVSQSELDRLASWPADLVKQYDLYSKYYRGEQRVLLTDRLKEYLERNGEFTYNENYCEVVVETQVERLKVIGISTSEDADPKQAQPGQPPPDDLSTWMWEKAWDGSQGDQLQIEVHRESAKKGDSYIVVDYDSANGKPRFTRNAPDTCRVIYKDGQKFAAIKKWRTADVSPTNPAGVQVIRMNVYFNDRVEKWFKLIREGGGEGGDAGGWVEWLDDGDTVWPIPWQDDSGKPLGVPVFHFANNPDDDHMGRSELRSVIPQQDRLNKELVDLSSILDAEGWPQRYATGTTADGLKSNPGEIWSTENPDAKFGQFEAADPAGVLRSIESTIVRMADRSRTPRYLLELSGGAPSGEAMKTAEAGLIAKVADRQVFNGNQWSEVLRMAAMVTFVFGTKKPPVSLDRIRAASINIQWKDPATRNEKEHLETLALMQQLGIPQEELWARMEGIDVQAMKDKKQESELANASKMMDYFNRGGATNPPVDGQGGGQPPQQQPPGQQRPPGQMALPMGGGG